MLKKAEHFIGDQKMLISFSYWPVASQRTHVLMDQSATTSTS